MAPDPVWKKFWIIQFFRTRSDCKDILHLTVNSVRMAPNNLGDQQHMYIEKQMAKAAKQPSKKRVGPKASFSTPHAGKAMKCLTIQTNAAHPSILNELTNAQICNMFEQNSAAANFAELRAPPHACKQVREKNYVDDEPHLSMTFAPSRRKYRRQSMNQVPKLDSDLFTKLVKTC